MKRNINYLAVFGLLALIASACQKNSFLDKPTESFTEEAVFTDSGNTMKFLNNIYAYTGQDIWRKRDDYIGSGYGSDQASLEDLTTNSTSYWGDPQLKWMTGGGSPVAGANPWVKYWETYYRRIRETILLMENSHKTPLSKSRKSQLIGEARYLRAFYYAALIRIFGAVQIMPNRTLQADEVLDLQRNSYRECVDYITKELDTAAMLLPNQSQQLAMDFGRATKGAALSLKARVLLTAASPLFNGQSVTQDAKLLPLVSYSATLDKSLWENAAAAFKTILDANEYALVEDNNTRPGHGFWTQFVKGRKTTEMIFPFMIADGTGLESSRFPSSRGGSGYSNPSDNMVRAFGMKTGLSIKDANSEYNAFKPYENRDPRFYYSVIFNQAKIYKAGSGATLIPVNIYFDKKSGSLTQDGLQNYKTKTGYYCSKMANDSTGNSVSIQRSLPTIRFAEIIMGYAECLNELGRIEESVGYLNMIRRRAGIEPGENGRYGIPVGVTQENLRSIIQNEYRVEFFQEGHWYYDTRRWRTAERTEGEPIQGMYITKELDGTFTYKNIDVIKSIFLYPAMYFAPIPQLEINKSATMFQNPGWE